MGEIEKMLNEGYYFLKKSRLEEGEECFLKVLKKDENNIKALSNLGFIKYFQHNFKEGLYYCDRVIIISPKDAYSHKGKGLHLIKLGHLEEGINYLKKAIELDPDFMDPYYDLALTLYENNRPGEARKYIEKGAKRFKDKNFRKELLKLLRLIDDISSV